MSAYETVSTLATWLLLLIALAGVAWTLYKQRGKDKR